MKKKLLIATIPIVVVLLGLAAALLVIVSQPENEVYNQNISQAKSFFEAQDYQQAVAYYELAMAEDNTQEEPYYQIAVIYHDHMDRISDAIAILQQSQGKVKSEKLDMLLARYIGESEAGNSEVKDDAVLEAENAGTFNESLIEMFNGYSYSDYASRYTLENESFNGDIYTVSYSNLNMQFIYKQTSETGNILDSVSHRPLDSVRPTEIKVNDLGLVISGVSTGVSLDKLKSKGITNLTQEYDKELKTNLLKFDFSGCKFTVACDESGRIIGKDSYNVIVPLASNIVADKVQLTGSVRSATTANEVSGAALNFRQGMNVQIGEAYGTTETGADGGYSMLLEPGDYTVEITAPGYSKEFFNVNILGVANVEKDFVISPVLSSGSIRIVLEWGTSPRDLDSHLVGTSSDGTPVSVYYSNKQAVSDSGVIAQLDVDDTTAYGPETITVNDTDGNYTYRVHQFSSDGSLVTSGAVVKVYMSSDAQPTVIQVPSSVSGEWWDVFRIEDGQIVDINGTVVS